MNKRTRMTGYILLTLGITCLSTGRNVQTAYAWVASPVQATKDSPLDIAAGALDTESSIKSVKLNPKQKKSVEAIMTKRGGEMEAGMEKIGKRIEKDVEGLTAKILEKHDAEIQAIKKLPADQQDAKIDSLVKKAMSEMLPSVIYPYKKDISILFRTSLPKIFADVAPLMTPVQKPLLDAAKKKYFASFDKNLESFVTLFCDDIIKESTKSAS
jgi:hypothetical protein